MYNNKYKLTKCVKELYKKGFTSSISGNHSIRVKKDYIWITPSRIPRYYIKENDLVKVNIKTGKFYGKLKPSTEWKMHVCIYRKMENINAVIHTHSPYTLAVAISPMKFRHILEEAKIIVGTPVIIQNIPSGSNQLAEKISKTFGDNGIKVIIILNHGVVAIGENIEEARAVIESLEEWAKIMIYSKIMGGPKKFLNN